MTLTSFIDSCWYVDVFEAQAIANVYLSRTQNAGSESTNYFEARTSRPTHIDPSRIYEDPSTDPALINIHYPPSRDQDIGNIDLYKIVCITRRISEDLISIFISFMCDYFLYYTIRFICEYEIITWCHVTWYMKNLLFVKKKRDFLFDFALFNTWVHNLLK